MLRLILQVFDLAQEFFDGLGDLAGAPVQVAGEGPGLILVFFDGAGGVIPIGGIDGQIHDHAGRIAQRKARRNTLDGAAGLAGTGRIQVFKGESATRRGWNDDIGHGRLLLHSARRTIRTAKGRLLPPNAIFEATPSR